MHFLDLPATRLESVCARVCLHAHGLTPAPCGRSVFGREGADVCWERGVLCGSWLCAIAKRGFGAAVFLPWSRREVARHSYRVEVIRDDPRTRRSPERLSRSRRAGRGARPAAFQRAVRECGIDAAARRRRLPGELLRPARRRGGAARPARTLTGHDDHQGRCRVPVPARKAAGRDHDGCLPADGPLPSDLAGRPGRADPDRPFPGAELAVEPPSRGERQPAECGSAEACRSDRRGGARCQARDCRRARRARRPKQGAHTPGQEARHLPIRARQHLQGPAGRGHRAA